VGSISPAAVIRRGSKVEIGGAGGGDLIISFILVLEEGDDEDEKEDVDGESF